MDIPFRPIKLEDKGIITSFTLTSDYRNCDFSFANMCSWRFLYDSEFAIVNGYLLIRFRIEEKSRFAYMMPVGEGDLASIIRLLEEDSLKHGHPLCMLGITPDAKARLDSLSPDEIFYYISERDYFDYIYLREDLASLHGKKYQAKRNHVNNFKKYYSYQYISITPDLVQRCLDLEAKWYKANGGSEEEGLSNERRSITYALRHFEELGLVGGAIQVEDEIVAFSFGAPINHDTFGVHVEKADVHFEGSYAIINQEFASHLPDKYIYVNREEDLGIPGLRQAKLSYQPTILLEKCAVIKRQDRQADK